MYQHRVRLLQHGDIIGITSTSSPVSAEALQRMTKVFQNRGYRVEIASHVLDGTGFMAGSPEDRASDLNEMMENPEIRLIMTATGGKSALHMLPLINYDSISKDPKLIVGLSDPSIILNAISVQTGVPTFHGPNGYTFGYTQPSVFSASNFWPFVTKDINIPYVFPMDGKERVLRGGDAVEGRLFGGHLGTNIALVGTPWAPQWDSTILFVEEIFTPLHQIDAMLGHLRLAGVLSAIRGMIVGQCVDCNEKGYPDESLEEIILRNCRDTSCPILYETPIGHTEDKLTLPIGCRVRLSSIPPYLTLLESPTRM